LRRVQTPQGFAIDVLRRAHAISAGTPRPATDDASLVEALGVAVTFVDGDPLGFKVTRSLDLAIADALIRAGSSG
jgi:2-C-methyl-D-erythritol 4-phosphate cytidylyltransferase